jgi:hypothetical protein
MRARKAKKASAAGCIIDTSSSVAVISRDSGVRRRRMAGGTRNENR